MSDRPLEFFEGKLENLKKMKLGFGSTRFTSSEKSLVSSFEISKLIAQSKKNRRNSSKAVFNQSCRKSFGIRGQEKNTRNISGQ